MMAVASRPRVALLGEAFNTYPRAVIHGIHDYLCEHQPWSIHLAAHGCDQVVPTWLSQWKGDGIIARVENEKTAKAILKTGLPTVDVSFGLERAVFPRVVMDNLAITRMAAEHLLERGFTVFGYCGQSQYYWSRVRGDLFARQVQTAGHRCYHFDGAPAKKNGRRNWELEVEQIAQWLEGLPKPIGIMACYDERGRQVLEACRRMNIAVPDEAAVIGVHNDELLCETCDPPLTSVISNGRRVGYEAAALLDRMMAGQRVPARTILFEPTGVATRQSTDVVAVRDVQISKAVRFIREHACEAITVADVLRAVSMSRTVLERRFKKLLKRTPQDHILRVRLERVKALLASTDLPLAEIAERAGFEHLKDLRAAFKRTVGNSPDQYRQRRRP